MKTRVEVEIRCLRQQLTSVALRKFPWCGADPALIRDEVQDLARRLRAKFLERGRL
jgi:hypothetical protein